MKETPQLSEVIVDGCPRKNWGIRQATHKQLEKPRTQATRCTNTLQLGSNCGLGVLDLVTLIQHAIVPPLALEPPVFCQERFIRGDAHVEFSITDVVLESSTFRGLAVET